MPICYQMVEFKTEGDNKKLYKVLKERQIQFHTFVMPSEKSLKTYFCSINPRIKRGRNKKNITKNKYINSKIYYGTE